MEENMEVTFTWRKPSGEIPDGNLLVDVDTNEGSDIALVYIDDDESTLICCDDYGDVWTAWQWVDVSRYALMEDILPKVVRQAEG